MSQNRRVHAMMGPMRYDKWGQWDAVEGESRKENWDDYPEPFRHSVKWEYDLHYDHAIEMMALGVDPRRLRYADPDFRRSPEDYDKFPTVTKLLTVLHHDGTTTDYCYQESSEKRVLFSYDFQAPDEEGRRFNVPHSLRYIWERSGKLF